MVSGHLHTPVGKGSPSTDLLRYYINVGYSAELGARGGAVGWGTALQAEKVASSIPDGTTGIFHWHNPSGRTMALGLTQPLTEMSSTNISWGVKVAGE